MTQSDAAPSAFCGEVEQWGKDWRSRPFGTSSEIAAVCSFSAGTVTDDTLDVALMAWWFGGCARVGRQNPREDA